MQHCADRLQKNWRIYITHRNAILSVSVYKEKISYIKQNKKKKKNAN